MLLVLWPEQTPAVFTGTVGGHRQKDGHIWWWFSPELRSASHLNWLQVQTNTQSPSLSGVPCHHPSSLYCANVELDNIIIMTTTDNKTYLVKLKKIRDMWLRCTPLFCYSSLKSQMFRIGDHNICHFFNSQHLSSCWCTHFEFIFKFLNNKQNHEQKGKIHLTTLLMLRGAS